MSIRLTQPSAYADLGDAWLRDQIARLTQKHAQFAEHYRIDADALLARWAHAARAARAAARVSSGERIGRATVEAIERCAHLEVGFSHARTATMAH
jgi:hypothetical protein